MDEKKEKKENLNNILTTFHKIKNTVSNLKQVNNILYKYIFNLKYRQMIFFSFLLIINRLNIYLIQIK